MSLTTRRSGNRTHGDVAGAEADGAARRPRSARLSVISCLITRARPAADGQRSPSHAPRGRAAHQQAGHVRARHQQYHDRQCHQHERPGRRRSTLFEAGIEVRLHQKPVAAIGVGVCRSRLAAMSVASSCACASGHAGLQTAFHRKPRRSRRSSASGALPATPSSRSPRHVVDRCTAKCMPAKLAGATPMISKSMPPTRTRRPMTSDRRRTVAPNVVRDHHHRVAAGDASSSARKMRPSAGRRPSTPKKLPLTANAEQALRRFILTAAKPVTRCDTPGAIEALRAIAQVEVVRAEKLPVTKPASDRAAQSRPRPRFRWSAAP